MLNKTPNANAAVTVSGRKKLLVRLSATLGLLVIVGLLNFMVWQATNRDSALGGCPFLVPNPELGTGKAYSSYVDRGVCMRLGRVTSTQSLEKGLSGRDFMPTDEGLLFVFGRSAKQCMWMKDMRFNLDMVWLDSNRTINHIETNLSPQSYPNQYCGNGDAAYVIEVNSGVAAASKLKIGQKLNF